MSRTYVCNTCGYVTRRYEATTKVKGFYMFHGESLVWHFIMRPNCNEENRQRLAAIYARASLGDDWDG